VTLIMDASKQPYVVLLQSVLFLHRAYRN
jgi:hypothetical protein